MAYDTRGPWFKLILLGESGVGKTSIFHRVKSNKFHVGPTPTIAIDSCTRIATTAGEKVTVTLWDTAGVERFRTLTRNYYRNAHGALLVYNVNDPASLQYLLKWAQDIESFSPSALKFIIGNKMDLEEMVLKECATDFARSLDCDCAFLTSAKTGNGIEAAIKKMTEKLLDHYNRRIRLESSGSLFEDGTIDINDNKKLQSACFC